MAYLARGVRRAAAAATGGWSPPAESRAPCAAAAVGARAIAKQASPRAFDVRANSVKDESEQVLLRLDLGVEQIEREAKEEQAEKEK